MNSDIDFRDLSFDVNQFNPNESLDDLHWRFHDNTGAGLAAEGAILDW